MRAPGSSLPIDRGMDDIVAGLGCRRQRHIERCSHGTVLSGHVEGLTLSAFDLPTRGRLDLDVSSNKTGLAACDLREYLDQGRTQHIHCLRFALEQEAERLDNGKAG